MASYRILKTHIRPYDVPLIYAAYAKCEKIQIASSREKFVNTNKKTIIEFGSRKIIVNYSGLGLCDNTNSALIIPYILLDLTQ